MLPGQSSQCRSIRSKFDTRNKQKQRPRKDETILKGKIKIYVFKKCNWKRTKFKIYRQSPIFSLVSKSIL